MVNFEAWESSDQPSIFSKILGSVRKRKPLKDRVSVTIQRLRAQRARLEEAYRRMQSRYDKVFRKCASAVGEDDSARSSMYANECAEIRKMCQTILRNQFALERVALRLETVEEFGDIAVEISPVVDVVNSIRGSVSGIMPRASNDLVEIGKTLNDLVTDSGRVTANAWNVASSGEAAERILEDANAIAEQKLKEKFPSLPDAHKQSPEKSTQPHREHAYK